MNVGKETGCAETGRGGNSIQGGNSVRGGAGGGAGQDQGRPSHMLKHVGSSTDRMLCAPITAERRYYIPFPPPHGL